LFSINNLHVCDSNPQSQQTNVRTPTPLLCAMPSNMKSDLIQFTTNSVEDSSQRYFYKTLHNKFFAILAIILQICADYRQKTLR